MGRVDKNLHRNLVKDALDPLAPRLGVDDKDVEIAGWVRLAADDAATGDDAERIEVKQQMFHRLRAALFHSARTAQATGNPPADDSLDRRGIRSC
ncbi:MAG: hypothetical protein HC802_11690 [Caldilineaceae bacterium]|nr:hypothetical protein [Caldilineaceae bacterium]